MLTRSLVIATIVVSVLGGRTMSAWAGQAGGYCEGSQSVAAINQYCEDIPGSTGAAPLSSRTRPLASVLSPAVLRRLTAPSREAATTRRRAELLTLPAPSLAPIAATTAPARASTRSADTPLLVVAIAVALLMAVIAAVTRRRRST